MALDPAMDAALRAPFAMLFRAVEIILPGPRPLRLLDGAGEVAFQGQAFAGLDPELGALASAEVDGDGQGREAPEATVSILPPTNAAAAILCSPQAQGSRVMIWDAVLDSVTGLVVPGDDLLFWGEIDVPELIVGEGSRLVNLRCVSVFERFFELEEGARLNGSFHQSIWPGELGFGYVTDVQRALPWGSDAPRPSAVTDVNGGGGSGSGGGGGGGGVSDAINTFTS